MKQFHFMATVVLGICLILSIATTNCAGRGSSSSSGGQDAALKQTELLDSTSEDTPKFGAGDVPASGTSTDHERFTESAYDYDEVGPGSGPNNGFIPPTTTAATKVYERVVLEGSKISISCPHYTTTATTKTTTIAPAETLFATIQWDSNGNEHKQSSRVWLMEDGDGSASLAALNSNSELRVKWFRNHVPLQNLNHFHHQRSAQRERSFDDEDSANSASLLATAATKVIELNQTTELSQTVPTTLGDKQQWQEAQRNLLKTTGLAVERSVNSLSRESVNEPPADDRKLTNILELRPTSVLLKHPDYSKQQQQQQWYVNKFGELVINKVSRYFAGKYTCLVEGKQSEVLLDVLLDSQAADKRPEQAYRIGEEDTQQEETPSFASTTTAADGRDVFSAKAVANSSLESRLTSFKSILERDLTGTGTTAAHAAGGSANNNELALRRSLANNRAREKTGNRPVVFVLEEEEEEGEEKDHSESKISPSTSQSDSNPSVSSVAANLAAQQLQRQLPKAQAPPLLLPTPTTTDWQKAQETGNSSPVDENSSEVEVNSIKILGDGQVKVAGGSNERPFLLATVESDYVLKSDNNLGGNRKRDSNNKKVVKSTLSVPSVFETTEIKRANSNNNERMNKALNLRSYFSRSRHSAQQSPNIHLTKSEIIQMSDIKSVPGFLYTKQQLYCPVAFSQEALKQDHIYPLILALCPMAHSRGPIHIGKHEVKSNLKCYHLAEHLILQLTRNCSTSILDIVWFKDGKQLDFDTNGKGKDKELNVKLIDFSEFQFSSGVGSNASASTDSRAYFEQNSIDSNIESSLLSSSPPIYSSTDKLSGSNWTCPFFSGRTLEIDGVRKDSAGLYTCAFKLNITKLEKIVYQNSLSQLANKVLPKGSSSASSENKNGDTSGSLPPSSAKWSQVPPAPVHNNDISCCDERSRAFQGDRQSQGFRASVARHRHQNRLRLRRRHQQQQQQQQQPQLLLQQSLHVIDAKAQSETNASKTIGTIGSDPTVSEPSNEREQQQQRINLADNGDSLAKRIAILESILKGATSREQSLNYIGRLLSGLQIPLEATTTIQTFSLVVTERAANSCDLWTTIAEAGSAYTRRKLADFRRLRRSLVVEIERRRKMATSPSRRSSNDNCSNLKNFYAPMDKSSSNPVEVDQLVEASEAEATGRRPGEEESENDAAAHIIKTRPIKRSNANIDGSTRRLNINSSGSNGGRGGNNNGSIAVGLNANEEYNSMDELGGSQYRKRPPNQSNASRDVDVESKRPAWVAAEIASTATASSIGDESSERNERQQALNALHSMPDNNDSETVVFSDHQQGYNLLLNNADELESDIEMAVVGQTKSNSRLAGGDLLASSPVDSGDGNGSSVSSRLHGVGGGIVAKATPFNYANEASAKKLGRRSRRSTNSNPTTTSAFATATANKNAADEARSKALFRHLDRQRFNMMIEANHDYSAATEAETKDLITQRGSRSVAAAGAEGIGDDGGMVFSSTRATGRGPESGGSQADGHPMVIDDQQQQDKVARPIIDGNLASADRASGRGYVLLGEDAGNSRIGYSDDDEDILMVGGGRVGAKADRAIAYVEQQNSCGGGGDETASSSSSSSPLTNVVTESKSKRLAESDVKTYAVGSSSFGGNEANVSWSPATTTVDEKGRDKRQDPLQGNKLLPLTIGGQSWPQLPPPSWQANAGRVFLGSSENGSDSKSASDGKSSRSKDDEKNFNRASQLNSPDTQYSELGAQFLIDVQTGGAEEKKGKATGSKVSPTNQSASQTKVELRNFTSQQITSAETEAAVVSLSNDSIEAIENDDNDERGSISFANDQVPIFSDDRLDESLMWTAGQYLYMHMKALTSSSIFGVEVDVEWSNERTNGGTDIDLNADSSAKEVEWQTGPDWRSAAGHSYYTASSRYTYPHDAAPFATIDVISGQNLHLQCTAQALGRLPEVKWYKRINTLPLKLKGLVKMARRIGHNFYWPLNELDLLNASENSKQRTASFVCSQTTTIFDNLTNQTFTVVSSLQLSQYNDVVEPETIKSNSLTGDNDYNLYACIVDADVRHNYATLGVHLREAPRKIPLEISKRLHARSAALTNSPNKPVKVDHQMRLIQDVGVTSPNQQKYANFDRYRETPQLKFPLKNFWVPIENSLHMKKREIAEFPLTPALLSIIIGFVFSSLLALLYLTFRSYRTLTNFQLELDMDESLTCESNRSSLDQDLDLTHQNSVVVVASIGKVSGGAQEQDTSAQRITSHSTCSCQQLESNLDNSESQSLTSMSKNDGNIRTFNDEGTYHIGSAKNSNFNSNSNSRSRHALYQAHTHNIELHYLCHSGPASLLIPELPSGEKTDYSYSQYNQKSTCQQTLSSCCQPNHHLFTMMSWSGGAINDDEANGVAI